MHKKVLVCLPLNEAHRAALEASVPEFEFRFNALDDVHAEDVLWADVVLGNAPVSMISQNKHIEWFQSNSAGPDAYLKPGVLPENCMVTNATGAYGLAISEWMLAMWLGIQKDMFLYRDRQNQRQWAPIDRPVRGITGARVLCVGMGDIGSNFACRAHMLGAAVVGVRRTVHPDTPCPDYCLRVVAQSQLDEELPEADLIAQLALGHQQAVQRRALRPLQGRGHPHQRGPRHHRGQRRPRGGPAQRQNFWRGPRRHRPGASACRPPAVG